MPGRYASTAIRNGAAHYLTVPFSFAHLKLFQRFDALQKTTQVTIIPPKGPAGRRGMILERGLVFLGF